MIANTTKTVCVVLRWARRGYQILSDFLRIFYKFNSMNLISTKQTQALDPRSLLLSARLFFRKTLIANLMLAFTLMPTFLSFKAAFSALLSPIWADFFIGALVHTPQSSSQSRCQESTLEVLILKFVHVALTLISASFLLDPRALKLPVLIMLPFSMQHFFQVCKRP